MKALSQKLNKVLAVSYIALTLLPSEPSLASPQQVEDWDSMVGKPILIKNLEHQEFLYLPKDDRLGRDRITKGSKKISSESLFTLERNNEGYLIKNIHFGAYLYVTRNIRVGGCNVIEANTNKNNRSYFKLSKEKFTDKNGDEQTGIVIKGTLGSQSLLLSDIHKRKGYRVVKTSDTTWPNGHFCLIDGTAIAALFGVNQN